MSMCVSEFICVPCGFFSFSFQLYVCLIPGFAFSYFITFFHCMLACFLLERRNGFNLSGLSGLVDGDYLGGFGEGKW